MTLESHCIHSVIHWTRTVSLLLSIAVIVLSLHIYHRSSVTILALSEKEFSRSIGVGSSGDEVVESPTSAIHGNAQPFFLDMIYGKKLIASLVAAQASIFCPLLLMMNSSRIARKRNSTSQKSPSSISLTSTSLFINSFLPIPYRPLEQTKQYTDIEQVGFTATAARSTRFYCRYLLEQTCQFLMPLGLAMCWIFSILYDRKSDQLLMAAAAATTTLKAQTSNSMMNDDTLSYYYLPTTPITLHSPLLKKNDLLDVDSFLYGLKYSIITTLLFEMWSLWFSTGRYLISAWLFKQTNVDKQHNQGSIKLPEDDEEHPTHIICQIEGLERTLSS
ncbi:hypothetical protein BDF20DRAFT_917882 [Mycotypha africana]|uniref:uncharacterized protein n=1 Tax=Mycotypha africana TaxID=64632 RepID=UPI002301544E|nr:uncharacterized protein BDF20DRAFT_917882 [Mycotypha africana]KAI8967078.1 hypothetical protein BDF20DRAFT_917882 [Mycotypha africana]